MTQIMQRVLCLSLSVSLLVICSTTARAQVEQCELINRKLVKVFGSGGFRGINSYGSGIIVSSDGFVLTVASPLLDTGDLRVHLSDGRKCSAKVIATEPELDAALIKIQGVDDLPFFDVGAASRRPLAQAGDWILAFSNQFQIATREEPVSVQHGLVAAYTKLHGKRGYHDAAYTGEVYILDAITNNPGAGGGALTTRRGELLGILGKELRNSLSDTFINYSVPIQVLAGFVEKARRGDYKPVVREKPAAGQGGYHGLILVPNVVERTPPFIEDTVPDSPAAKAGLAPDDLIVYVDGEKITSISEFQTIVEKGRPGSVFKLEVRRGDRLVPVELRLELPPRRDP